MRAALAGVVLVILLSLALPASPALAQTGPTGPTATGSSDLCAWEWGGVVEAEPSSCPEAWNTHDDEVAGVLVLGLGLIVFLSATSLVASFAGRGRR